jgi:hypothetical protein
MPVFDKKSALWSYLPPEIQSLIEDGEYLLSDAEKSKGKISDFSYLVFPFSKAYEGFLKKLFLDIELIREDEFYSDDIRIGRILNPHYINEKENVFERICRHGKTHVNGVEMAEAMWKVWKRGRNQVFHYFPHNFRRLGYEESLDIINELNRAMELSVKGCGMGERHTLKPSAHKKNKSEVFSII